MTVSKIVGLYMGLLIAVIVLMLVPHFFLGPAGVEAIAPIAGDAFKTVLGAAIGALSVALSIAKNKESSDA